MSRPLQVGDVLANKHGGMRNFYFVVGFSSLGKTVMCRGLTGREMTAWWSTEAQIPDNWWMHVRADDFASTIRSADAA